MTGTPTEVAVAASSRSGAWSPAPAGRHVPRRSEPHSTVESTAPRTHAAPGEPELVLGRYRLSRRLGSGGMGTVWLAHDERLDRAVAVKRIGVEDPEVAKRAQREARAAARLAHPGIVALYEAGQDEDAVFLVSELVRGRTLARLMADGLLSDRDVLDIGVVLCDALAHAHQRGVVHRDVKPANVMVPDDGGPAKLTDFGIAQLLGDDALTRTGDVVGTLAYMAPEQAEGRAVTWSADLYALGLVLFEALAGVNPVRGRTPASTIRRVGERLPALGRLRRDLPLALCDAIDAAVAPHPEQRGRLADLKRALKAARAEVDDEPGTIEAGALEPFTRAGRLAQDVGVVEPATRARRLGARGTAALGVAVLTAAGLAVLGPAAPVSPVAVAAAAGALTLLLPRLGWACAALALLGWVAAAQPGLGVLVAAAVAPVPLLLRRAAPGWWSAPGLALGLGVVGLPGAWVAVAGQARRVQQRAALGALGAWWLLLAEPAAERALLLGRAPGTDPRAAWEASAGAGVTDALAPLLSGGGLVVAAVWAAGAAVLPWLVRGRSAGPDLVGAAAWSAGVAAATQGACTALAWPGGAPVPHGLVAGAVAAGVLAVAAKAAGGQAGAR
jgi:eukaryotic-like serine/threonine-protein kinase